MASLTQQPQLYPAPNLEPPGFDLIRDILMRKFIGEQASPYGLPTNAQGQVGQPSPGQFAGNGRGMFNPYTGGYDQSQMPQGGGMGGGQQMEPGPMMPGGMQGGGTGQMMQAMQQPRQQGGSPGYGFDGYTLNNQITTEGNLDGMRCSMGHDGCMGHDMPGAPPMQMQGPQPGGQMPMRPPQRPPMDPRKAMAIHAIMAAMMAKRRGMGQRPPMRPPMGGPPPPMGPRPMGMDAPMRPNTITVGQRGGASNPGAFDPNPWPPPPPTGGQTPGAWGPPPPPTAPGNPTPNAGGWSNTVNPMPSSGGGGWSVPTGGDPRNSTQGVVNMENQWNQGWGPKIGGASGAAPTENPSGNTWSTPQNYSTYDMENWFSGGAHPVSQPYTGGVQAPTAAATTPMGHDSPYNYQRGPMAPLGMDAPQTTQPFAGPGLPGPIASNFGGGSDPAVAAAIAAIMGGGGGTGIGGGGPMDLRQKRPMGFDGYKPPKPPSGKFVVAGRGGRTHRIFDEPRMI